ncbi:Flp pilus assembly protein CpaB [Oleidesulfovibrio sp.]|uniref:Flp pilus assembly protein CpaB n=1 Tax=Oleidesulfovibrio sp. TaxID=2909707 RepID=UPI003A84605F
MTRSSLIQISLALILALVAGVLVFRMMRTPARQVQVQEVPKVTLAVAAADIAKGTKLREEHLKIAEFLQQSAPKGAFASTEEVIGRVVATAVSAGEPLTPARLVNDTTQYGGVSTMVMPGKRAVAVKGNKVLGIAGFIRPGNHVDVLVTIDDNRRKDDTAVTKTVLENIRVLATGTELQQEGDDSTTSPVDIYTLEMTPDEVEILSLASARGQIHFSLRNPADKDSILTKGIDIPRTLTLLSPKPKPKARGAASPSTAVEVISGTERSTLRFKQ